MKTIAGLMLVCGVCLGSQVVPADLGGATAYAQNGTSLGVLVAGAAWPSAPFGGSVFVGAPSDIALIYTPDLMVNPVGFYVPGGGMMGPSRFDYVVAGTGQQSVLAPDGVYTVAGLGFTGVPSGWLSGLTGGGGSLYVATNSPSSVTGALVGSVLGTMDGVFGVGVEILILVIVFVLVKVRLGLV